MEGVTESFVPYDENLAPNIHLLLILAVFLLIAAQDPFTQNPMQCHGNPTATISFTDAPTEDPCCSEDLKRAHAGISQ